MDYNAHKQPVLRGIYARMFRAHGLALIGRRLERRPEWILCDRDC